MTTELLTWHDAFRQHCQFVKRQSKHTLAGYRHTINSFVKYAGASRLAEVNTSWIEYWITQGTSQRSWPP